MAFRKKASVVWDEWKQKLQDKGNRKRVLREVEERFRQGREALGRLEKDLRDPETQARLENRWRDARSELARVKAEFQRRRKQAAAFTKEKPEQALVAAAAAGALAGALWVALRRKKKR